jgi:hypothetical protein
MDSSTAGGATASGPSVLQPLFFASFRKTQLVASCRDILWKSPRISFGAVSTCLSSRERVVSVSGSWLNRQLSLSSGHCCPVWKYLQGNPLWR